MQVSLNNKYHEMKVIFRRVLSHNLNLDFRFSLHAFRTENYGSGDSIDLSFVFGELSDKS